jgi:3-oxoacyl-[acyl-carrier protein] reductase
MNERQRFIGKVVLVTGAGRGIGKAISHAFAAEGAKVVVQARTAAHGQAVVDAILQSGGQAALQLGDVGRRADVRAMVTGAIEVFGALDILVHSAADAAIGKVSDMSDEVFASQVNANIHSLFWLSKDALPALCKATDKGRLIFISSGEGNRSHTPGLAPYGASKAYMNAFARTLAREIGPQGVLVNVVEPGLILSDRMREHLADEVTTQLTRNFPVPRAGLPSEIASAVLFLASKDAAYITGSSLLVDGGATLTPIPAIETHFQP